MKTCFMIGHRDANMNVYELLENAVEHHIVEYGVKEFIVGHYGNFDCMAAQAVQTAKTCHPEVQLILLRPYLDNYPLPQGFDGSVYPEDMEYVPKRFAILRANYKMIENCDYVIAYVRHPFGGAYQCMEYARRRKKQVINLGK